MTFDQKLFYPGIACYFHSHTPLFPSQTETRGKRCGDKILIKIFSLKASSYLMINSEVDNSFNIFSLTLLDVLPGDFGLVPRINRS